MLKSALFGAIILSNSSLSQNLQDLLSGYSGQPIPLGDIFTRVGDKGFGILLIFLSLPSALPVPAPGYSTPFGILLAVLGLQMLVGRRTPWLPARVAQKQIPAKLGTKMLGAAVSFFDKIEHLIRPRMQWVSSRFGQAILGLLVIAMACLMILPIPLTNTAPAMVIFLIGVALAEDDGLFALLAAVAGLAAVALYALVIWMFLLFLNEFNWDEREQFKDWLKTRLNQIF